MELWNKKQEELFFREALNNFASIEQLFYSVNNKKLAYYPKKFVGKKETLQARNSLVGNFTEKWVKTFFESIVKNKGLYVVQDAVCEELALSKNSAADVVISKSPNLFQKPEDIVLIIEVKMSIVWNWEYLENKLYCIGDATSHTGNPSILRSDSVLKAIGKSINIRLSSELAKRIPILVIGNTPITSSYIPKVDKLKKAGVVQGFWSLNPEPYDFENKSNLKRSIDNGFVRFDDEKEVLDNLQKIINTEMHFFQA